MGPTGAGRMHKKNPPPDTPSRRTFCARAGHTVSLATLGIFLPGCGSNNPTAPSSTTTASEVTSLPVHPSTTAGNVVTVAIGPGCSLATIGSTVRVEGPDGQLIVTRSTQDSFIAVTATCTHAQCTVSTIQDGILVCPCHGSRFSTSGTVRGGPASMALSQFPTTFDGSTLSITI